MKDLKYIISLSYWGGGGGFEILVKLCNRDKLTVCLMQSLFVFRLLCFTPPTLLHFIYTAHVSIPTQTKNPLHV